MKKEEIIKDYLQERCRVTFLSPFNTHEIVEGKIIFVASRKDAGMNIEAINVITDKNESCPINIKNILSIDKI